MKVEDIYWNQIKITHDDGRYILLSRSHKNYVHDVIERFEFYWKAVKPIKNMENFSGSHYHELPDGKQWLFSALPETPDEIAFYLEALDLQPGDVVLDGGSYCGLTAWSFAEKVGKDGMVICVEPDPVNYEHMAINFKNNPPKSKYLLVKGGLWCDSGFMDICSHGNTGSKFLCLEPNSKDHTDMVEILSARSFQHSKLYQFNKVKLDIEGAEIVVAKDVYHAEHGVIEAHPLSFGIHTKDVLWGNHVNKWGIDYVTW